MLTTRPVVLSVVLLAACAGEDPIGMPCDSAVVPADRGCEGEGCADGLSCASVVVTGSTEDVTAAAAGTCVVLEPGSYPAIALPAGVSLLGRGAGFVRLEGLTVLGGGSTVRGVQVAGPVTLEPSAEARLEAMCVAGGVAAGALADVAIAHTHVVEAPAAGVRADAAASLTLSDTRISRSAGPGIWAACEGDCACSGPVQQVRLERVEVEDAALVGVALYGGTATLAGLSVHGTRRLSFEGGGAVAMKCVEATAHGLDLTVSDGSDAYGAFGMLLDTVSGRLGDRGDEKGIIVVGGRPGIWLTGSGPSLEGFEIQSSVGVGLGISPEARGIIVVGGKVLDTATDTVVLAEGGSGEVGDGVSWGADAEVAIEDVALSGSGRQSILIDGPVAQGSQLKAIALSGGDEMSGILQQGVSASDPAPAVEAAPAISREPGRVHPLAAAPTPPSGS